MSNRVYFLDVASHQVDGQYPLSDNGIKSSGAKAGIIKLTEGNNGYGYYVNPYAKQQIEQFKRCGVNNIHFYNYQHGQTVKELQEEARRCVAEADKHGYKGAYIFLDTEEREQVPSTSAIKAFYDIVRKAGYRAGFYTYQFMYPLLSNEVFTSSDGVWAAAYPLGNQATSSSPNFGYFPSVDNCIAWQFTDNWKGLHVDCSITLTDDLLSGSTSKPAEPEYYTSKLKRVRLKKETKIYKDNKLNNAVRSYPKGTEFEIKGEPHFEGKMSRYQTESGLWITGNMEYVDSIYYLGKEYSGKTYIRLTKSAYLYKEPEFKNEIRKYNAGTEFKVVENVALSSGRRCFKVESGYYITANKDYCYFVR